MPEVRARTHEIAKAFDERAGRYGLNEWHRRSAERLVTLCRIRPGERVLDAGTGTGFAAMAAARATGAGGRVVGVDVSRGMLREARAVLRGSGLTDVELVESDATCLPQYESGSFDVVTCATALHYMPVDDALHEWHRLLKAGGRVAFSTMRAGSPPSARVFRQCAAEFGVVLRDPSEPLGSARACRTVLAGAGFTAVEIVSETIEFTPRDLALAWESNFRSAAHEEVRRLDARDRDALKRRYLAALEREERDCRGSLGQARILYAFGRR